MSDTESFEASLCELMGYFYGNSYATRLCERIRRAHDREIRDVSQQQYDRGFHAGQHSMDAEHRAVAMRLRGLRFDGGSHENLSRIAYAIYPCATGWTCESAAGLRDKLIDLIGGVSDDTCGAGCCCAAADSDGDCGLQREEVTDGRTADDCGGDTGGSYRGVSVHLDGLNDDDHTPSIAYELRKWASDRHCKGMSHTDVLNIGLIADRIDEQFDRICHQQEAVLQKTIDGMVDDRDSDQLRIDKLVRQRDAAYACADELSDELLRVRRERDEARNECDRLKCDMLDKWVPRTSYEEKVEKYRRAYMESDAWRKSLQEKLNAMRDAITAALNG